MKRRPRTFPLALCALTCILQGRTALGQGAVRDAVRELEEAEARLGRGIYQVPLPGSAEAHESEKKTSEKILSRKENKIVKEGEPRGIDISPAEEKGGGQGQALGDVAARLAALEEREGDLRARIVRLQDDLAARLDDVGVRERLPCDQGTWRVGIAARLAGNSGKPRRRSTREPLSSAAYRARDESSAVRGTAARG